MYKHYVNSVGNNLKHIQITTKYRYKVMNQEKLRLYCKVAIEETCKRHKIEIEIVKVLDEHVHMIVDLPRTMSDARAIQILKGASSRILFLLYPTFRDVYPRGHFWNGGYFCVPVGVDFDNVFSYIENQ